MDMVGRGTLEDSPDMGPDYVHLIGSRRMSNEYGDMIDAINVDQGHGFRIDYQYDAPGHPQRLFCRSDHWSYAKYGIPVAFFGSGDHRDYHMLTDEPQYIDYDKLRNIGAFAMDILTQVANLGHALVRDHPRPDPTARCAQ